MSYNPEIVITEELMQKFASEADAVITEITKGENAVPELIHFRDGYIAALRNVYIRQRGIPHIPFPVSLSTADMIGLCNSSNGMMILLGRKPNQPKFQFPGGFRDPRETSTQAAKRELNEEACLIIENSELIPVGKDNQLFVDDVRYRDTPHKITTSVFYFFMTEEQMPIPQPGDDLKGGEVKWFSLKELCENKEPIRDIHIPLFDMLVKHLITEGII